MSDIIFSIFLIVFWGSILGFPKTAYKNENLSLNSENQAKYTT